MDLGPLLTRVTRLNNVAIEAAAAEAGMTASEGAVLGTLAASGLVLSPTQLQVLVIQSPGGLTKTLRRLESAGHVRRRPDPGDRRSLLVELTPAGRRACARASAAVSAHYDDVLADLDAGDRDQLQGLLERMLHRLGARTGHSTADGTGSASTPSSASRNSGDAMWSA